MTKTTLKKEEPKATEPTSEASLEKKEEPTAKLTFTEIYKREMASRKKMPKKEVK